MDRSKVLCFPPFVCLLRVIWEIWQDGAEGIIIVPDCANQLSLSQFCNMITKDVVFPPRQDLLLSLADPNISHSLHQTLQLRAATVSGKLQKPHTTQKECKTYSWHLGHPKHKTIIIPTFKRVVLNFAPTQSHPVPPTPIHSHPLSPTPILFQPLPPKNEILKDIYGGQKDSYEDFGLAESQDKPDFNAKLPSLKGKWESRCPGFYD